MKCIQWPSCEDMLTYFKNTRSRDHLNTTIYFQNLVSGVSTFWFILALSSLRSFSSGKTETDNDQSIFTVAITLGRFSAGTSLKSAFVYFIVKRFLIYLSFCSIQTHLVPYVVGDLISINKQSKESASSESRRLFSLYLTVMIVKYSENGSLTGKNTE